MILTNCAAGAAPLPHPAKQCSRCKTLYCGPACQRQHWERGGHDALCKKIKKGGGAEQYHADQKYKEAVAEAVEACRGRHEGQKCYICLEAVHPHTGEGLVRGCGCGDRDGVASPELGVAHVSCLARQAKVLFAEAQENNLDYKVKNERWKQWTTCGLCGQEYHGVVRCALGWGCWKTYVGLPEGDWNRNGALTMLGNGLNESGRHEDWLAILEVQLATLRRLGSIEGQIMVTRSNLALCLSKLGRLEESLAIKREVYAREKVLLGTSHLNTLITGRNLLFTLNKLKHYVEVKALARRELVPRSRHTFGSEHDIALGIQQNYAEALFNDPTAFRADILQAVAILEDVVRAYRRVLGKHHPDTLCALAYLERARMKREDVAAP